MSDDECRTVLEPLATVRAGEDHIKKLLLAVRNVNHLTVSEDDPQRLFERACASLTETMGYLSAWIVQFDEAGHTVTAMASSGFERGLDLHAQRLKAGEYPGCMRRALGRDGIVVVKNQESVCVECLLSDVLSGRCCWSWRLDHDGKIYGFLSVSVPAAFADDQEEQSLFDETTPAIPGTGIAESREGRGFAGQHCIPTMGVARPARRAAIRRELGRGTARIGSS